MTTLKRPLTRALAAPVLALLLLSGIAVEHAVFREPSADAADYHVRVAASAKAIPLHIGPWSGVNQEVPRGAITLLNPNALVSRSYENVETGEHASLMFIHCRDSRDLLGHFPPFCYPAHGYTITDTSERDWLVDGIPVYGKRYRFQQTGEAGVETLVVDNFMVLPEGSIARDMTGVNRSAQDLRRRQFGAAQVQVLTGAAMDDERRDEVLLTLVKGCLPAIQEIALGVEP